MIDINKQYRTRDGREVRIYATDGGLEHCMTHGAAKSKSGYWEAVSWYTAHGGYYDCGTQHCYDLVEVCPRHKRAVWLIVWSSNYIQVMNTPEWQISTSGRSGEVPYACIKVDLDYEEGEGL
jgi:hypothetical protein